MHTKRYRKLSEKLYRDAVWECLDRKWTRNDVLGYIEKYAGIPRNELLIDMSEGSCVVKNEAVHSIALHLQEMVEGLLDGEEPEIDPPLIRSRPDGMTGKVRDIALLNIDHQMLGHVAKLMMEPLFSARILPTQHASMPGRGQTMLKDQVHRYLLKEKMGIKYAQKTDIRHAYKSLQYEVCIELVKEELPKADDLVCILAYLGKLAPGGHLIIGGYIDAWLFNYAMSYAIRYLYSLGQVRRGKFTPYIIRVVTYMDDFALFSHSIKGLERATKSLDRWLGEKLRLSLKVTTGIIRFFSVKEEQRRRHLKGAAHGVPVLDMAGFKISRSRVAIRRRAFLRMRRQLLRAYRELKQGKALGIGRAEKIVSYNSYIVQTDSYGLRNKYHVKELFNTSVIVTGNKGRLLTMRRKEKINAIKGTVNGQAEQGRIGEAA